jgi:glucose-1-phosphate cytidylyltransferase
MKVIILAGGRGSRISFYTQKIPKPMIKVGNIPMLTHIMRIFKFYGHDEFIIAAGYKRNIIKNAYKNSKEFTKIKVVNTGLNTMTGGRLLKLKKFIKKNEDFFVTYGDGVANINLKKLLKFHLGHKKIGTVTAVRPPVKFGELNINSKNLVNSFVEKPQLQNGWVNGGFFIFKYKIFSYIKGSKSVLERTTLNKLTNKKQLAAYKHNRFWKCMDNLSEKEQLEKIFKTKRTLWKIN